MIGIYKITSPSDRVYVGQSRNINRRKSQYKTQECKYQKKLHNSIKKYGWCNHTFEVIEECPIGLLNERERYWQDYYDVLGDKGLNCMLTKTKEKVHIDSAETRDKKRKIWIGRKHTEETKKKMSLSNKGRNLGKKINSIGGLDITGKKFNMLTALSFHDKTGSKLYWKFICDCGKISIVCKHSVTSGSTLSCGCLATKKEEPVIGSKYGRLTIIEFEGFKISGKKRHKIARVTCQCECGNVKKDMNFLMIKKGHASSCGCIRKEQAKINRSTYLGFVPSNQLGLF